ncbi:MAG TPA: metallopeptidase family protein [Actinomycetes bacterium]|nr:metallopeptidase family protein [Actinomycetes bacterium]
MFEITRAEFEELVSEALDGVPAALLDLLNNVVVLVEDEPRAQQDAGLLGLYEGIPLTARDSTYSGVLPDHITIFRGPVMRMCSTPEQVVSEVRITVVHEIAHHFGIDDDRLHDLGYG